MFKHTYVLKSEAYFRQCFAKKICRVPLNQQKSITDLITIVFIAFRVWETSILIHLPIICKNL